MLFKFTSNEFYILNDLNLRLVYIGFYHLIDNTPYTGKKYLKFKSKRMYKLKGKYRKIGKLNKLYYGKL